MVPYSLTVFLGTCLLPVEILISLEGQLGFFFPGLRLDSLTYFAQRKELPMLTVALHILWNRLFVKAPPLSIRSAYTSDSGLNYPHSSIQSQTEGLGRNCGPCQAGKPGGGGGILLRPLPWGVPSVPSPAKAAVLPPFHPAKKFRILSSPSATLAGRPPPPKPRFPVKKHIVKTCHLQDSCIFAGEVCLCPDGRTCPISGFKGWVTTKLRDHCFGSTARGSWKTETIIPPFPPTEPPQKWATQARGPNQVAPPPRHRRWRSTATETPILMPIVKRVN